IEKSREVLAQTWLEAVKRLEQRDRFRRRGGRKGRAGKAADSERRLHRVGDRPHGEQQHQPAEEGRRKAHAPALSGMTASARAASPPDMSDRVLVTGVSGFVG